MLCIYCAAIPACTGIRNWFTLTYFPNICVYILALILLHSKIRLAWYSRKLNVFQFQRKRKKKKFLLSFSSYSTPSSIDREVFLRPLWAQANRGPTRRASLEAAPLQKKLNYLMRIPPFHLQLRAVSTAQTAFVTSGDFTKQSGLLQHQNT